MRMQNSPKFKGEIWSDKNVFEYVRGSQSILLNTGFIRAIFLTENAMNCVLKILDRRVCPDTGYIFLAAFISGPQP